MRHLSDFYERREPFTAQGVRFGNDDFTLILSRLGANAMIELDKATEIGPGLTLSFDGSKGATVTASVDTGQNGVLELVTKPRHIARSSWFSIEIEVPIFLLRSPKVLTFAVTGSCAAGITCFAALRAFLPGGVWLDVGSMEIDINNERGIRVFPITLTSRFVDQVQSAESAKVILFLEGRDVETRISDIKLYSFSADQSDNHLSADSIFATLDASQLAGSPRAMAFTSASSLFSALGSTPMRIDQKADIFPGVRVYFEQIGSDKAYLRLIESAGSNALLRVDFARARRATWRSLDIQLNHPQNAQWFGYALRARASSPSVVRVVLRAEIDGQFADQEIVKPIALGSTLATFGQVARLGEVGLDRNAVWRAILFVEGIPDHVDVEYFGCGLE